MNKKIKRLATTTIICVLVASIFGSVMVLAPPPDFIFPQLIDVFVTNTSDDPVPVDVTDDTLDVTLDEPIEVTLDEPIDVEVTNALDVSGWLHTTKRGHAIIIDLSTSYETLDMFETTGYKQLAISFNVQGDDCNIAVTWYVRIDAIHSYVMYPIRFSLPGVLGGEYVLRTYDVIGDKVRIEAQSEGESYIFINYYMTT